MREIKFRAWVTHELCGKLDSFMLNDGDWYETTMGFADSGGDRLLVGSGDVFLKSMYDNGVPYKLNAIAMQYIGCKDKNGVDIYEGDIVRFKIINRSDEPNEYDKYVPVISVVEYDEDEFTADYMYYNCPEEKEDWGNVEVIGNIYENSNLLEQQEAESLAAYLRVCGYAFTHVPNETAGDPAGKRRGIRMKRAGTSKGFPDYIILAKGKRIAIELKSTRPGAKATPEQLEWLKTLNAYGFECAVCHGRDEAVEFVESVVGAVDNSQIF